MPMNSYKLTLISLTEIQY